MAVKLFGKRSAPKPEVSEYVHPQLGPIEIYRSRRSRRITVTIRNTGSVRLTIPYKLSLNVGLEFLESRTGWIKGHMERLKNNIKPCVTDGFKTYNHTLRTNRTDGGPPHYTITDKVIELFIPDGYSIGDAPIQDMAREAVNSVLRSEAEQYLPHRVQQLSIVHGFSYSRIVLRNATTRWGSCSGKDSISLNIQLMRLPEHLIDYIILHELCHTVHKNHGPGFHELLNKVTHGGHYSMRRELKDLSTRF